MRTAHRAAIVVWVILVAALVLGALTDDAHSAERRSPRWDLAKVTVVDETNGAWPALRQVEDTWDRSKYVRVTVAASCVVNTYCVTVRTTEAPGSGWLGQTTPTTWGSALVELNTGYPDMSEALRSAVYCHELGHALGVAGHLDGTAPQGVPGCIAGTDPANTYPLPTGADLSALRQAARVLPPGPWQEWGATWWAQTRRTR